MKYTLFQDFAHKIRRLAPPTGHPGRAQSGHTPEFGYGPYAVVAYHFVEQQFFGNVQPISRMCSLIPTQMFIVMCTADIGIDEVAIHC